MNKNCFQRVETREEIIAKLLQTWQLADHAFTCALDTADKMTGFSVFEEIRYGRGETYSVASIADIIDTEAFVAKSVSLFGKLHEGHKQRFVTIMQKLYTLLDPVKVNGEHARLIAEYPDSFDVWRKFFEEVKLWEIIDLIKD